MSLRLRSLSVVISCALFAACAANRTSGPSDALLLEPTSALQGSAEPFGLHTKNVVNKYPLPDAGGPNFIALGSDKNVWFTENTAGRIGRITPTGSITEFTVPSGNPGVDISPGKKGTLWFTASPGAGISTIGKITTAGAITEYPLPSGHCGRGIAKGPDGNTWFVDPCSGADLIGKITPTGTITEYPTPAGDPGGIIDIVAGPDGNMWFVDQSGAVGKVTTAGAVTEFSLADTAYGIAAGPDGNLYVPTFYGVWRVTTSGTETKFQDNADIQPRLDIVLGPDKQMWITDYFGDLTEFNVKTNTFSTAIVVDGGNGIRGLTLGGDGDVWIADTGGNAIAVYEERVDTIGIRLNGELSFNDPNYGFELGYAVGSGTQTQTIGLPMGESVRFKNLDTISHSAAFLGNATANSAPWPGAFNGSTTESPAGTAIGTTGWATGSLSPGKSSPIYETGLPGFYMVGCQFHYNSNEMRTVIVVH